MKNEKRLSLADVRRICPACAEKMARDGLESVPEWALEASDLTDGFERGASMKKTAAAGPYTLMEQVYDDLRRGKLDDDRWLKIVGLGFGHTKGADYVFGQAGSDIVYALIGYESGHKSKEEVLDIIKKNIAQALRDNEPFKGMRGEDIETHNLWMRMMKEQRGRRGGVNTAGRSYTPRYIVKVNDYQVFGGRYGMTDMEWKKMYGRPTEQNIRRYVETYNASLEPDGVNSHLGRGSAIYGARIVDQTTGETVVEWADRSIIQSYKSKPMFEVVSYERRAGMNKTAVAKELVMVAKELAAAEHIAEGDDIHKQLQDAGVALDHHESDLYAEKTPVSDKIIRQYEHRSNVTTFRSQQDGKMWYDIPFAYTPFWSRRQK